MSDISEGIFVLGQNVKSVLAPNIHTHIDRNTESNREKQTQRKKGNPLPPHGLLFPISSNVGFVYAPSHRQDSTYHGLCCTSRGALAGTRYSSMGRHRET